MEAGELLSWAYTIWVRDLDPDKRREVDYALTPDEALITDDPDLPPVLRERRPPAWYVNDDGGSVSV